MPAPRQEAAWPLLSATIALILIGLAAIYSATFRAETARIAGLAGQQGVWAVLAVIGLVAAAWIPQRIWAALAYPLFGVSLLALLIVLGFGARGMGAERWLVLGPLRIQPSEMAKLATVLALARYLSDRRANLSELSDVVKAGGFALAPLFLVIQQPDLGTALVFSAVFVGMAFWAGVPNIFLLAALMPIVNVVCALTGLVAWAMFVMVLAIVLAVVRPPLISTVAAIVTNVAVGIATPALWGGLATYQRQRILTLFDPESDPLGAGYQIIQSKVAVGSGDLLGRGWLEGSQTQLAYLPERHTDFVFSVIGEEFGFVGTTFVLGLLFVVLWRGVVIARMVNSSFSSFVCIGVVTWLAFHTVVNVGMTVGLMPVVGLPLPLVSYGGSALVANCVAIGIVAGARLRRLDY
ncbi:MAG: rod shape-determining protein RodA [Candidatus Latescibacteria bacterium]|jgi:rod shape determining protein RodA|nr:rod shape-determining protein RodA [Candidatus Latescibacterota bacterium]